jgi:hypothetical protein
MAERLHGGLLEYVINELSKVFLDESDDGFLKGGRGNVLY